MSATYKLFLATALVVAGFGVARLLGKPVLKPSPRLAAGAASALRAESRPATSNAPYATGVRLVPDFKSVDVDNLAAEPSRETASERWLKPIVEPIAPALAINTDEATLAAASPIAASPPPRASLRSEAPRPLDFESQPTAPAPSAAPMSNPSHNDRRANSKPPLPASWPGEPTKPARFDVEVDSAPAITASYNTPLETPPTLTPNITPVSPPPWPAPGDEAGPRKHVVVDGDSLARLAGRYLDDPHRSHEIFEVNRGLLNDPELLPIGVELVIPSRTARFKPRYQSPQSLAPRTVAIHAPSTGSLVPVGPVPSSAAVAPRAQLMGPVPVE